jgi:hypothetical protein
MCTHGHFETSMRKVRMERCTISSPAALDCHCFGYVTYALDVRCLKLAFPLVAVRSFNAAPQRRFCGLSPTTIQHNRPKSACSTGSLSTALPRLFQRITLTSTLYPDRASYAYLSVRVQPQAGTGYPHSTSFSGAPHYHHQVQRPDARHWRSRNIPCNDIRIPILKDWCI